MTRSLLPAAASENFGDLLKFLRRRARMTQRDLALAVGYTEAHLCRLEKNERLPDLTTVAALFIPALELKNDPQMMELLLRLAAEARSERRPSRVTFQQVTIEVHTDEDLGMVEDIPAAPAGYVERPGMAGQVQAALESDHCVALCGLAGMGKTSLAAAVARRFDAGPVFWHTFTPGVTTSSEAVLHHLALFFFSRGKTQMKPLVALPAGAPPLPLEQRLALLRGALARQPILLCFDDVHTLLGDEPVLAVLRHLCASSPARVLLTSRQSLPLPVTEIALGGLENAEGVELAKHLGLRLPEPALAHLLERTAGSPILLRLAAGQLQGGGDGSLLERLEAQPQVSAYLLNAMLGRLSPAAEWLAELVAVFRQPVDLYNDALVELVESLNPGCRLEAAVGELQRSYLLRDPRRAGLHPLVREHLHLRISANPQLRRRLHRLAGEWSEKGSDEILEAVYHYTRAGLIRQAVDAVAGQEGRLFQRGQAALAAGLLEDALRQVQARGPSERNTEMLLWLYSARGDFLVDSSQSVEAEADYRQALALASNPQVRADVIWRLSSSMIRHNRYADALQLAQEAAAALPPGDTLLHARLHLASAMALYNLARFPEARQQAEDALALVNTFTGASWRALDEIRARAHYWLANTARIRREPVVALEQARLSLAAARSSSLLRIENVSLGFIGGLLYDQGDVEASYRYRCDSLAMALELGDFHWAGYLQVHLASNHLVMKQPRQGLERLDQARDLMEQVGDAHGQADQANARAAALLCLGEVAAARSVMEELLSRPVSGARQRMAGYHLSKMAAICLCDDPPDVEKALAALDQALKIPAVQQDAMLCFDLDTTRCMAHLVQGDVPAALHALEGSPATEGLSLWVRLDRLLAQGYAAAAQGREQAARQHAADVHARSPGLPLYAHRAARLEAAALDPHPVTFARCMWVFGG